MQIQVNVTITSDDQWTMSGDEAAAAVLDALGGDPDKDLCSVMVHGSGQAGTQPAPPTP
jgi:hypothetical protein